MKQWNVRYCCAGDAIENWLDELNDDQFEAVQEEVQMLATSGNELGLPHSRALGKGLFELRERRYEYRIYYTFHGEREIVLLAAGDKKSQERDIEVARERLAELDQGGTKAKAVQLHKKR